MGATRGKQYINLIDDSRLNSIKHYTSGNTEEIQVETIDEFSREHGISYIDFMKIDTEGWVQFQIAHIKSLHIR